MGDKAAKQIVRFFVGQVRLLWVDHAVEKLLDGLVDGFARDGMLDLRWIHVT